MHHKNGDSYKKKKVKEAKGMKVHEVYTIEIHKIMTPDLLN